MEGEYLCNKHRSKCSRYGVCYLDALCALFRPYVSVCNHGSEACARGSPPASGQRPRPGAAQGGSCFGRLFLAAEGWGGAADRPPLARPPPLTKL